jgi:hypothetical protein
MPLPHCDTLFTKFLDPWYSDADRKRKRFESTRPDILTLSDHVGVALSELTVLREDGEQEVRGRIDTMLEACRGDWPRYLTVFGDVDEHWIHAFDEYYDRKRIADVITRSDPADFSNDYLILVCEFGAALGHVLCAKQPRLTWVYDWPYWESSLVDLATPDLGLRLAVLGIESRRASERFCHSSVSLGREEVFGVWRRRRIPRESGYVPACPRREKRLTRRQSQRRQLSRAVLTGFRNAQ